MKKRTRIPFLGILLVLQCMACGGGEGVALDPIQQASEQQDYIAPSDYEKDITQSTSFSVQVPIWISDGDIHPHEIELFVGQNVTLDILNSGIKNHNFTIGRNVVFENGKPIGFEIDFFEGISYSVSGADIVILPIDKDDEVFWIGREYWLSGQPTEYDGFMVLLPRPDWQFIWKDSHIMIDFFFFTQATIDELTITQAMVGEWEYACFAEGGQHYLEGERGKIIVKQP